MRAKNLYMLFIILLFTVLLSGIAAAIGVSPIRKVVDFESGAVHELYVKIRNDGSDIDITVSAAGELAKYVEIIDSSITMTSIEDERLARYKLKMPINFDKPGTHKGDIIVTIAPKTDSGDTVVSASVSLISELRVNVPYQEKYAEAKQYIRAGEVNEEVQFAISVINYGVEDIKITKGLISILGAEFEKVDEVETDEAKVVSTDQAQLRAKWLADVNPGQYYAKTEVSYDNEKITMQDSFLIGKMIMNILDIDIGDFKLGDVLVFEILVGTEWNDMIESVYAEIIVLDQEDNEKANFKTASADIPGAGQTRLKGYWDTKGFMPGKYKIRVLVHYAGKITEMLLNTEVERNKIKTDFIAPAKKSQTEEEDKPAKKDTINIDFANINKWLIWMIIVFILLNIIWVGYIIIQRIKGKL